MSETPGADPGAGKCRRWDLLTELSTNVSFAFENVPVVATPPCTVQECRVASAIITLGDEGAQIILVDENGKGVGCKKLEIHTPGYPPAA